MHRTILVAATPDDAGRAALSLGVELARPSGARVLLVGVATGRYDMAEDEAALAARLEPLLDAAPPDVHVDLEVVASDTVVHGLLDAVARHAATLLVLGPSHRGLLERLLGGDVAVGAGASATCAVAVAQPEPVHELPKRMGVAWDGTPQADEALEWAVQLAERTAATLQVIRVLDPRHREGTTPEAGTAERVEAVAAAARARADVTARTAWGDAAPELLAMSHELDLLVVGSRPRGVVARTLLGSVSADVVHDAACAVVVIPPGVHAPADTAAV